MSNKKLMKINTPQCFEVFFIQKLHLFKQRIFEIQKFTNFNKLLKKYKVLKTNADIFYVISKQGSIHGI